MDGQLKDLSDVVEDLSGALDRAEEMGQLGEESPQFRVRGEGASLADDIGEAREVEYRGLLAEQGTSALGLGWGQVHGYLAGEGVGVDQKGSGDTLGLHREFFLPPDAPAHGEGQAGLAE